MELNDSILPSYRSGVLVWGYPAVSPARADHPLPTYCRPQPRRGSNGKNIARGRTELCPRARVMSPYCGACCDNPTTTTTISSSSPHLRSSGASTAVVQVTQSNIEISQPTSVPHIALSHWYHWKHVNHSVTDTRSSHRATAFNCQADIHLGRSQKVLWEYSFVNAGNALIGWRGKSDHCPLNLIQYKVHQPSTQLWIYN